MGTGSEAKKKRVISGMRPTGRLHIGHYFGALRNWIELQNDPQYECFFFIADWHALTSDYADTSGIAENSIQIAMDYLAAGLDPEKSTIFLQSLVPEHAELFLLLSMVTPLGWLERVPTYKEALENVKDKDLHTYGFLGYPVLQTGDIALYGEPDQELLVPVGEDQKSHVELSREIARRFNGPPCLYGLEIDEPLLDWYNRSILVDDTGSTRPIDEEVLKAADRGPGRDTILRNLGRSDSRSTVPRQEKLLSLRKDIVATGFDNFQAKLGAFANDVRIKTILVEPEVLLTETPRIPGTDGRKMSKSYNNFVSLSESDESIRAKAKVMVTDPARKRRSDPGNPDVCPVYDWHKLFSPPEILKWSAEGCRTAGIGCIECKSAMADNLIRWISPIRGRRQEYEKHPRKVLELLNEGSKRAQNVSRGTMARVHEAIFGWEKKRAEIGLKGESSRQSVEGFKANG